MNLVLCMSFYKTTYFGFVTELITACHGMIPAALEQCRLHRKHVILDICLPYNKNFSHDIYIYMYIYIYLIQNSQAVKKVCGPQKVYGEKRCEIQGGGQEMAVMVG